MPFITSVPSCWAGVRRPEPSTVAVTLPLDGLMRTICALAEEAKATAKAEAATNN